MATNQGRTETIRVVVSTTIDVQVYSENQPARFSDWRYAIESAVFPGGGLVPGDVLDLVDPMAVFDQAQAMWRTK